MNGTWTDVTGRIKVADPGPSSGFSISNNVVTELHLFQDMVPTNTTQTSTITTGNGTEIAVRGGSIPSDTAYTQTGDGYFDNYWEPHESRLIMLQGTRTVMKIMANDKALDVLNSSKITLKTQTFNSADRAIEVVNNTVEDTWSYTTELKQVQLTQYEDSYLYNTILGENEIFATDQFGVEVFIKPRS